MSLIFYTEAETSIEKSANRGFVDIVVGNYILASVNTSTSDGSCNAAIMSMYGRLLELCEDVAEALENGLPDRSRRTEVQAIDLRDRACDIKDEIINRIDIVEFVSRRKK